MSQSNTTATIELGKTLERDYTNLHLGDSFISKAIMDIKQENTLGLIQI